ncbi:MAG: 3-ketoacyl-ACP reductase [Planctomycetes bacterium]|nr:3-ketoacyl-ACP reductase [Planctomycetota bacterium]
MASRRPVAIVTGSSRGIGRGIAERLADAGHDVVVNYRSRSDEANEVVASIAARGGSAVAVRADVSDRRDRDTLVGASLASFGRIDVLVNNAGITSVGRRDVLEATDESWEQVFGTNLKGPFFLSQAAAVAMIDSIRRGTSTRGTIVNISSISSYAASTNRADYCMAKAAMGMMTRLFADRLAEFPIRVHEVCPGVIASDMTAPVREAYDRRIAEGLTPIRRWGTPEDVAKVVAVLVGDDFDFCTGQCFHVDGGFHIRRL